MERRFESEIRELKNQILAMGGLVEQAIERARQGSPASRVDGVQATEEASGERLDGFVTRRTL